MKPKICTIVTGNNLKEFLHNLGKAQEVSEMVELRVDQIQDLTIRDVHTIRNKTKKESIFTCRRSDKGGKFKGTEKERVEIINEAIRNGFEYVDIELLALEENLSKFPKNKKTIISYHNFVETPNESFLNSLIQRVKKFKPGIVKIATQVNSDFDILKLCKLIVNKKMSEKRIIIGMGEKGKIIRVMGPLLGNYLTYVSMNKNKSILGQLSITELKSIYRSMNIIN